MYAGQCVIHNIARERLKSSQLFFPTEGEGILEQQLRAIGLRAVRVKETAEGREADEAMILL